MKSGEWLTLLGILMGGGGLLTALITARTTTKVEEAKNVAVENQQELDVQKIKIDGWKDLVAGLQQQVKDLVAELVRKDGRIAELEAKVASMEHPNRKDS